MIPEDARPDFERTLLRGGYNLLVGSGISLDSRNEYGDNMRSANSLRRDLCSLLGVDEKTSLSRLYPLLDEQQKEHQLVRHYTCVRAGPSLAPVTRFLWRRLFTFNIDDVVEVLYERSTNAKQRLATANYDAPFEPTPITSSLQAIHLHGWVREPTSGFVFSAAEYARVMRDLNPWMHLLAEILATEPFIVAGSSLNEPDLEYYLSHRTSETPRRDRGPSLLIEPYPDKVTRSDCVRYGLTLVEADFGSFLAWIEEQWPSPPSVTDLIVPDAGQLFGDEVPRSDMLRFFSDFELVSASDQPLPTAPSRFLYGRPPEWQDINQHYDIERIDNRRIADLIVKTAGDTTRPAVTVVCADAGTGKSTAIKRVAHGYAIAGKPVIAARTLSRIDVDAAISCLSRAKTDILLLVDGLADHVDQVAEILDADTVPDKVTVLGAERIYRREYIDLVLGENARHAHELSPLSVAEYRQLLERYRDFGLVAAPRALSQPSEFAGKLVGDAVAIGVCRILNDFRPFDDICTSLWRHALPEHQLPYLCVALAQRCYRPGIRYSVLQSIMGTAVPLAALFEFDIPLPLAANETEDDFVVPANSVVAERLLHVVPSVAPGKIQDAFVGVARAIAPHVNRKAIMRRSPEARLAGRLFDADKIVRPLLGQKAEEFYNAVKREWEWNSRYWEQRALLIADDDLPTSLRYARHAVAIERHTFPMTTLAKLLLVSMDASGREELRERFIEATELLVDAIRMEARRSRTSVQPFMVLLHGTAKFMELGGVLDGPQANRLRAVAEDARALFGDDPMVRTALQRLRL